MNHLRPFALSRIIGVFTVSLFLIANSSILFAQSDAFKNGSFETQTNGHPDGWYFPAILSESGITMSLDSATPFEGNQSALVDTTKLDAADPRTFGMLNQILDAKNFQGKRVRFRAAVKTAERTNEGRAQLWLRVDRKPETGQRGSIGAFDNMQDRPITVDDWQHFEIVADIEEDAVRLTVGMLVMGKTKAWIDGASLEIVDEEVTTTAKKIPDYSIADKAPPQSFFNAWLWLAMIAIFFFLFSQTKNNLVQRFALRFSIVYWLLYSFPSPFTDIIGSLLATLAKLNVPIEAVGKSLKTFSDGYDHYVEQVVHWVAQNGLGIEGDLILPNGSGDTTFAFVRLLVYFGTAFCVALIWSGVFYKRIKPGFATCFKPICGMCWRLPCWGMGSRKPVLFKRSLQLLDRHPSFNWIGRMERPLQWDCFGRSWQRHRCILFLRALVKPSVAYCWFFEERRHWVRLSFSALC
jgi:hypothetical protein